MPPIELTTFDYVAFAAMAVVFFGLIYLVIWLGDLPARIATKRHHPQVAAVQAMAWLGLLFTGGVVYILAFVWAYYDYSPKADELSDSQQGHSDQTSIAKSEDISALKERIATLESALEDQSGAAS